MKKTVAEPYRDIDFTHAKRGAVIPPESKKTKISIRLDTAVLDYFRNQVEKAGCGNYQTLINEALVSYMHQESMLAAVRQVVREELRGKSPKPTSAIQPTMPSATHRHRGTL